MRSTFSSLLALLSPALLSAAAIAQSSSSAGAASAASDSVMVPGVSHALAEQRASQLSNVRYEMQLNVTRRDTAVGRITMRFERRGDADVIVDFRGPSVSDVRVNGTALAAVEQSSGHLRIPRAALRSDENQIEMSFASLIAPAGASIIRFHDETDNSDYLYTLLVPSDANALFPCFDQPDLKARVTLSLVVPPRWIAMANGITAQIDSIPSAKRYRFRETEPLSTYLVAFAAGPWREFSGGPRNTRLFVRASRAREVEVDSLQQQIASALNSLERYFGVPYPFQQFQYLLAPAFPFGGMEHPGAVFFNEESFIFREPPTLNQRLGRRATIYHEVAHQWFGDLVTMRWFDDLWLKEGFATYMAAKMQDMERLPNPWMSFYLRNKPAAYDVDLTAGTTPVWQALENLDQAKSNYGAIVYNKAPGVLKQLDYLVGDSAFRAGVHAFLVAHRFGNATWRDLLDAIGTASGRPLREWGAQYILRAGMPVIEQQLTVANGRITRLALVQHPAQSLSGAGSWPVKLEVLIARHGAADRRIPVELRGDTTVVTGAIGTPAPDFIFANANDFAYGLVLLDDRSTEWLEQHIGEIRDPFLRAMLWGSLWDLVRDARLSPSRFAAAAMRELPAERDEQIAAGIVGRLSRSVTAYMSAAQQQGVIERVESLLLAGASDTTRNYGMRKSQLDAYIDLASSHVALRRIDAWLDSLSAAGMLLRQPTRWSIVTRLVARDAPSAAARLAAETRRDTSTGGQRRAFVAGAARPQPDVKHDYFARYLGDPTLNEEWVTASLRSFNDPDQSELSLPYLVPALDSLPWIQRNRRIFFLGAWLGAFVGGQRNADALARVDAFLREHPSLPLDLRRKVLQSRDDLDRTVRIRAAYAGIP